MKMDAVLFIGSAIGSVLGILLVVVFRERPERLRKAIDAGQSAEFIEAQRATLRRVRAYGWWVVFIGAFGMVSAIVRR
jgi:hypothetical protein